ncbi:MFS transporter [Allosphingosinicella deserti]|uniref:MFS transporter n=1 Tax=Allosphingosinicella deserti TaxID=2116704 RepID=A0A2P7QZ07_9SPHN|nr:MFS transporter [Sphingomonas deserti]PSJ43201.1 MFS transporter [Sphingomonas deserti]
MTDPPRPQSSLSPLRHPVFRAVWFASMVSNFGGMIQSVGASWMMTSISHSAEMVALVQASVTLPIMLLALVAGALADTFDRRGMMLAAQSFMLLVSAALAACAWFGLITPWLLLLFTFLIGCGTALNSPAWQASVGDMMPRSDLPGAVALNSMGFNIARSLGPALGGAIVAAAGAAAAFAINALTYVGLLVVLLRWKPQRPPRTLPRETLGSAIAAGLRYVNMSPPIKTVLVRSVLFGIAASSVPALMPLIARDVVAGGPLTYGLLLGSFGGGAVAGAIGSARLRALVSSERLVRLACVCFALGAGTAALSQVLLLTMAGLLLAGGAWVMALSTFNVTVQLRSPRWVVARALSIYQMCAFGGMAIGSWVWGRAAETSSIEAALLVAGGLQLVCALVGLKLRLPPVTEIDLDPLREWTAPQTAVPVEPRTGPVVVTIEYRIRQRDVPRFLAAMAERRRVRRRDGALHWTLLRDLSDRNIWIERYHTPTWLDYIRHNNRLTKDDAGIPESLRALHCGEGPPVVRRMIEREPTRLPASRTPGAREIAEPLTDPTRSA